MAPSLSRYWRARRTGLIFAEDCHPGAGREPPIRHSRPLKSGSRPSPGRRFAACPEAPRQRGGELDTGVGDHHKSAAPPPHDVAGESGLIRSKRDKRGRSSAGRASRSQCEGQGFDPPRLHHLFPEHPLKSDPYGNGLQPDLFQYLSRGMSQVLSPVARSAHGWTAARNSGNCISSGLPAIPGPQ
jgi:hypothetical protein